MVNRCYLIISGLFYFFVFFTVAAQLEVEDGNNCYAISFRFDYKLTCREGIDFVRLTGLYSQPIEDRYKGGPMQNVTDHAFLVGGLPSQISCAIGCKKKTTYGQCDTDYGYYENGYCYKNKAWFQLEPKKGQFKVDASSMQNIQGCYCFVTPILKAELVDETKSIVCGDGSIKLRIKPKDFRWPVDPATEASNAGRYSAHLSVALVHPKEGDDSSWKIAKTNVYPSDINLSFKDIGRPEWQGRELKVAIFHYGSVLRQTIIKCEPIYNIYFLPVLSSGLASSPLKCHEHAPEIDIKFSGLSTTENTNMYIYLGKYIHESEKKEGASYDGPPVTHNGQLYYRIREVGFNCTTNGQRLRLNGTNQPVLKSFLEVDKYYGIKPRANKNAPESECAEEIWFKLTRPDPLSLTVSKHVIYENGKTIYHIPKEGSTGKVTIKASGGLAGTRYKYKIGSSGTYKYFDGNTITISGVKNGDKIFLSNSEGCNAVSKDVSLNCPGTLAIPADKIKKGIPNCNRSDDGGIDNNGSITFSFSGGFGPYKVELLSVSNKILQTQNPATAGKVIFNDLTSGNYKVQVSYYNRTVSSVSDKINVGQQSALSLSCEPVPETCQVNNDGKIIFKASGGNGGFTYYVDDKPYTTSVVPELAAKATTYACKVKDKKGCIKKGNAVIVTEPAKFTLSIDKALNKKASCNTASNGAITLKVAGGHEADVDKMTLTLSNGSSETYTSRSMTVSDLSPGSYNATVENKARCKAKIPFKIETILKKDQFKISKISPKQPPCKEKETGEIQVMLANGSPSAQGGYKLQIDGRTISNYKSGSSITGLSGVKPYNIVVTDGNNCSDTDSYIIKVNSHHLKIADGYPKVENASCDAAHNGKIILLGKDGINASGKTPTRYQYSKDGVKYQPLTNGKGILKGYAKGGGYSVYVKDEAGCVVKSSPLQVFANSNPISLKLEDYDDQYCTKGRKGFIKVQGTSSGENQSLTYSIDSGEKPSEDKEGYVSFSNLSGPRTYQVTLKDSDGCSKKIRQHIINKQQFPILKMKTNELACESASNGVVTVSLTDYGIGALSGQPYKYSFAGEEIGFIDAGDRMNQELRHTYYDRSLDAYFFEVTDKYGCSSSESVVIPVSEQGIRIKSYDAREASCVLAENGEITVVAADGVPYSGGEYRYLLLNDDEAKSIYKEERNAAAVFEGLPVDGTYYIQVKDGTECATSLIGPVQIKEAENTFTLTDLITTHPDCTDSLTGCINPKLINIDPNLDYTFKLIAGKNEPFWEYKTTSPDTVVIDELPAGKYDFTVTASDKCMVEYPSIVLKNLQPAKILSSDHNYIKAKGNSTGLYTIGVSGGNHKYHYQWRDESDKLLASGRIDYPSEEWGTNFSMEKLPAGTYTFLLRDTAGCAYFDNQQWYKETVTIEEPDHALGHTEGELTHVSCKSFSDGVITLKGFGGWGNEYRYSLDGTHWQSQGRFDGLVAGDYTVTVEDTAQVKYAWPVVLTQPDTLNVLIDTTFNATCPLYANGRVEASVLNGIPFDDGLHYHIENRADRTQQTGELPMDRRYRFGKLAKGDYELFVTDSHGCQASKPFKIGEPDTAQITMDHNYIRAWGDATGKISARVTRGNGFFDYQLYKNGATTALKSGQTHGALDLTALAAGEYTLLVRDTARCPYEQEAEWMVRHITMAQPEEPLTFAIKENRAVSCHDLSDGSIKLDGVGGWGDYRYQLDQAPVTALGAFDGLPAGTYHLTVSDSAGISWKREVTVTQPDVLEADTLLTKDINCFGGEDGWIKLKIRGGNRSYLVSTDQQNWTEGDEVSGLPVGDYTVYVKDTMDCTTRVEDVKLIQPKKIIRTFKEEIKSRCSNNEGSIKAKFEGGVGTLQYSWSKDTLLEGSEIGYVDLPWIKGMEAANLFSSRYFVDVTDEHGCVVPFEFFVGDITDLAIDTIVVKDVSCWDYSNGQAKAKVIKGNWPYTYSWSKTIPSVLNDSAWGMKAGDYDLLVRDDKKCAVHKIFSVGTPDSLYYKASSLVHPLCLGGAKGAIQLEGTGGTPGYAYQWSTGIEGPEIRNVDPGRYVLSLTDAHHCHRDFIFDMAYQRQLKPFVGNDTLICHYNSLPLDAGAYAKCQWQGNNGFRSGKREVNLTDPGAYYLQVTDDDQCLGFDTLALDVSYLTITDLQLKDVTCNGFADGRAEITTSPASWPQTIHWPDDSNGTAWENLGGGDYTVKVTDPYGCEDSRRFSIYEPEALSLTVNRMMDPLCFGVPDGVLQVAAEGARGEYRYEWDNGFNGTKLAGLDTGTYVLDVYDKMNCHLRQEFKYNYERTIYPRLGEDLVICQGNDAKLYPGLFTTYSWKHGNEEAGVDTSLVVKKEGTYYVQVQDDDGCIGRDTMSVTMRETELLPEFLTASSVPAGDTLIMVEVSQPKPQEIEWHLTGEHTVVEKGDYFCKVIFAEEGMREVMLSAYTGGCMGQARKMVLVTPPGNHEQAEEGASQGYENLLELKVSPNPNDGRFAVEVTLEEAAPVNFYVVRIGTGQINEQRRRSGMAKYRENFAVQGSGRYAVFVESEGERRVAKVIVH
ncbi:hypothetical protein DMA11_11960 [Marinilabiliaceae bacterium JC017]|nr:hypothetical protein DMA11_11960 [Marinilabiliaceae bacterium JC017]